LAYLPKGRTFFLSISPLEAETQSSPTSIFFLFNPLWSHCFSIWWLEGLLCVALFCPLFLLGGSCPALSLPTSSPPPKVFPREKPPIGLIFYVLRTFLCLFLHRAPVSLFFLNAFFLPVSFSPCSDCFFPKLSQVFSVLPHGRDCPSKTGPFSGCPSSCFCGFWYSVSPLDLH